MFDNQPTLKQTWAITAVAWLVFAAAACVVGV